jgi:hypothetical protein
MKAFVVAISALLLASPGFAQSMSGGVMSGSGAPLSERSDDTADNISASNDGEPRICRRVETGSSSRMSTRRLCLTPAQWRDRQRSK